MCFWREVKSSDIKSSRFAADEHAACNKRSRVTSRISYFPCKSDAGPWVQVKQRPRQKHNNRERATRLPRSPSSSVIEGTFGTPLFSCPVEEITGMSSNEIPSPYPENFLAIL